MALTLKDNESNVAVGLGTFNYTVPAAGLYFARSRSNVLPQSGLSVVINKNGSPLFTSATPSVAQQEIVAEVAVINAAQNDVISFVLSSSNANDKMLNTVKTIIEINLANA